MTVVHRWLAEPLPRDVQQALERLAAAPAVQHVAVMPDVHLAEHVCIGTVVGTTDRLYPQAVGGDIGCGIAAVAVAATADALADEAAAERLFAALRERVPSLRQRRRRELDAFGLSDWALDRAMRRDLQFELGTLGRGNHFLEVQADEADRLWLMVHSGSRALGPAVRDHHLARGQPVGKGLIALPSVGHGLDYLHDHDVALWFARQNRRAIAEAAAVALHEALGLAVDWSSWQDVVHNFVRCERHGDAELWVHRKGAASADLGEFGAIPGSMGSRSFHVEGRGCAAALRSSSHGAGRRLPRGEAMRRISPKEFERQLGGVHFPRALVDELRDEAPGAYKDIGAVMRAQRDLVKVVRRLRPVLAWKGV
ncbi:MAG: RtcB family protein [Planctomycetes bacterium]|nr:RtcB family protein [Planctomycetota bacterium]